MKKLAIVLTLTLVLSILPLTSAANANGGSVAIWGIDPSIAGQELVAIDAFSGVELTRLPLPSITSTNTELGLAGQQDTLYYINGNNSDATVYILDPTDGSTKGTVTLSGGWDVDGLGWFGGVTGYLYTSGCSVDDMHRYPVGGGGPTFFWSNVLDPRAVGGDDTGRIFTTHWNGTAHVIAEVDPVNNVAMLNSFASPSQSIVGMAFDGTYLFVSDTQGMLYVLNPDDGTEINSVSLNYNLYALAIADIPLVSVEKQWTYTDVCFMQDNDGDGQYDEDPVDFDAEGNPIDNDGDGLYNEDPVECDGEYSLGTALPIVDDVYQLEAVVKKNGKVSSYNPGQFYAVSTVEVLADLDQLTITEDYSEIVSSGIGELNPAIGGGKVVVVQIVDGIPVQILDAMASEVAVDNENEAIITLEDVAAGTYMVYVKFAPGLKGEEFEAIDATNINSATGITVGYNYSDEASASIQLIEKVMDGD